MKTEATVTDMSSSPSNLLPAQSGIRPGPAATPSRIQADEARHRRKVINLSSKVAVAAAVLAVLLAGGYAAWSYLTPPSIPDIQLFTVTPRSFPVILEERGELQATNSIDIRCELEGRSTIIQIVPEGTQVKQGDLLVELASDAIDDSIRDAEIKEAIAKAAHEAAVKELEILKDENASKIRRAELALEMAQIALEKHEKGDAVEMRQTATLALEKAKSVLDRANENLNDSTDLFEQGFLTRIEREDYRFRAYEAGLELKKAELALEVLEKYSLPMLAREKESDVTEARKELDRTQKAAEASEARSFADMNAKKSELNLVSEKLEKLRDQKTKARIVAPSDGLVVYARTGHWSRQETQIQTGMQVVERQSLIELPDTSEMKVVIRVHEAQTQHLRTGLPAVVEIEGFSGQRFRGEVSRIAVLADSQNRWLNPTLKEYETEIRLEGSFTELKPGVSARARIRMAQLDNVLAVPVQSVFGTGGRYYVFLQNGSRTEPAEVKVGLASNEFVEVTEGLSAGDSIRLAISDEMKLMLPDHEDGAAPAPPVTVAERAGE